MKTIIVLALALCAVSAFNLPDSYVDEEFHRFQREFQRQYNGVNEQAYRKEIFRNNLERIHEHNLDHENGLKSFRLAVNQFADMTNKEYRNKMNGYKPYMRVKKNNSTFIGHNVDGLPDTVDWRTKGVVTAIKNQEQCGSCWAFSAVAGIEGQHALATKNLVSLSEQNLVDCSQAEGNQGCEGGLMDQAFEYVIKNGGIDTETSYSYKGVDEKCEFKKKSVGATVKGFTDVKSGDESALKAASATIGPISVAIDASSFQFQFYSSGVYDDSDCGNQMENLDHGVTAVGYGTLDGKDYWLVKNSWGTTWGEKGYIQMSRNKDNQCGIATAASYPTGVH